MTIRLRLYHFNATLSLPLSKEQIVLERFSMKLLIKNTCQKNSLRCETGLLTLCFWMLISISCSIHRNQGRKQFESDISEGKAQIQSLMEISEQIDCDDSWPENLEVLIEDETHVAWRTAHAPPTVYLRNLDQRTCFEKVFLTVDEWDQWQLKFSPGPESRDLQTKSFH